MKEYTAKWVVEYEETRKFEDEADAKAWVEEEDQFWEGSFSRIKSINVEEVGKEKEVPKIEFYQEDIYKMLDGMDFNAGNIDVSMDDDGALIIRAERAEEE